MMRRPLDGCSAYVASSAGAKETLLRAFPDLAARRFEVIPHGRDFGHLDRAFLPSRQPGEVLRVLLPGNISRAKGAEIIAQLAELDCEERFEFHVLGDCANSLKRARVFLHGPYEREEFPAIVERIRPHLGAVLSLWPETWSHTLTELWSVGLPVLAFDLGAQGERIRESGCGWLVAERTAEAVHALLVELQGSDGPHAAARRAVEAWRSGPARQESVPAMAARYAALYASLLESGPVEDAAPVAAVEHAA